MSSDATDNTMRTISKPCNKCGMCKPETEEFFHKDNKKLAAFRKICRQCANEENKNRSKTPESIALRLASIERNRKNVRLSANEWVKRNRAIVSEKQRIRREKNKKQTLAQRAVTSALRNGSLQRQPCFICGETRVEAHHADYDNYLGVSWLCLAHHGQLHAEFARPNHSRRLLVGLLGATQQTQNSTA